MRSLRGFSLVEMAIVLVLVGFVIGSIARGVPLIASAETRRVIADYRAIQVSVQTYSENHRNLPGDDPRATMRFAVDGGNGNGVIDGRWDSRRPGDESSLVWTHLQAAGLFLGKFETTVEGSGGPRLQPRDSFGRRMGIQSLNASQPPPIHGMRGVLVICTESVPAATARSIDLAVDDGLPDGGSFQAAPVDAVAAGDAPAVASFRDGEMLTLCQGF